MSHVDSEMKPLQDLDQILANGKFGRKRSTSCKSKQVATETHSAPHVDTVGCGRGPGLL